MPSDHSRACLSAHLVGVMGVTQSDPKPLSPEVPELVEQPTSSADVHGLTWSPDGKEIAFGVQPYTCPESGEGRVPGSALIYVWPIPATGEQQATARVLAEGSFPTWV